MNKECACRFAGTEACSNCYIRHECPGAKLVSTPDRKDTNPKDVLGMSKMPMSTLSGPVLGEVSIAMLEGSLKYRRHNCRIAGARASVYYDAAFRHLSSWWEGQNDDPHSGISHVTKAIAGLMVLRDSMLQGNWVDDRPPKATNQDWVEDMNARARDLLEKYPDAEPPYTELDVEQENG